MLHAGGEDFIRIGNVTSSQRWARPPPTLLDVGKYKEKNYCNHLICSTANACESLH